LENTILYSISLFIAGYFDEKDKNLDWTSVVILALESKLGRY
jgi:hypothetical protein